MWKPCGSFILPCPLQVGVYLNGQSSNPGYMAIYFHLTSGPNDDNLKWPCPWHQATMTLMDQQSDIRQHMNMNRMITTDPAKMSSDGKKQGNRLTNYLPSHSVFSVSCCVSMFSLQVLSSSGIIPRLWALK